MCALLKFLILTFLCTSCSSFWGSSDPSKYNKEFETNYHYLSSSDYVDHLSGLDKAVSVSLDKSMVKLSALNETYLNKLTQKILVNNELLLDKESNISVKIIKSKTPFVFSLPGGKLYISSSLLNKYVRYESLLAAILSIEIIKSERNYYRRNLVVPLGHLSIEKAILINRLGLEEKMEINKWSFFVLKRSGFDPHAILAWIQVLNKNTLELSLYLGEMKKISREETLLKSFIVNIGVNRKLEDRQANSSKEFYRFIDEIKEIRA